MTNMTIACVVIAILAFAIMAAVVISTIIIGSAKQKKQQPRDSKGRFTKRND